jgi:phage tail-like protein
MSDPVPSAGRAVTAGSASTPTAGGGAGPVPATTSGLGSGSALAVDAAGLAPVAAIAGAIAGNSQGGRFHLLAGERDWRTCPEPDPLCEDMPDPGWPDRTVLANVELPDGHRHLGHFEWHAATGSLRLAHREAVSRKPASGAVHPPEARRGADRDAYGTWYWIDEDRRTIRRLPPGPANATSSAPWWSLDDLHADCTTTCTCGGCGPRGSDFGPVPAPPPVESSRLAGLAVTTGHYLVAGLVDEAGYPTPGTAPRGGLLLFDLHGNGPPRVLRWPGDVSITPFDLSATADGGVLVLDRIRRTWWRLDRTWRIEAEVTPGQPGAFQPVDEDDGGEDGDRHACPPPPAHVEPRGNVLDASGPLAVVDPVAISEGEVPSDVGGRAVPTAAILVLDRPPAGPSAVVVCDPRTGAVTARLELTVEALDPTRPDLPSFTHDVVGHDLAWGAEGTATPLPGPLLYVADASTSGTEAYRIELDLPAEGEEPPDPPDGGEPVGLRVVHQPDELPMRSWEAKGLVAAGGDVYYDAVAGGSGAQQRHGNSGADDRVRWVPLEPFGVCNMERCATLRTPTGFEAADDPQPGQPFDGGMPGTVWHRLFLDADIPDRCSLTVAVRAADDPALLERLPFVRQPTPYMRAPTDGDASRSELPWHDPWADVVRPTSGRTGTWELLFQQVTGRYLQIELSFHGTGRTTPSLRALRAWYPRFSYVQAYLPEAYQEDDEPGRFLERLLANMEGLLTDQEQRIENAWLLAEPRTAPPEALDWLASWMGLRLEPLWSTARRRFLLRWVHRLYRIRGTVGGLRALLRLYLGCSLDPAVVFAPLPLPDDPARIVEGVPTADGSGAVVTSPHRFKVLVPFALDDEQAAMVGRIVEAARPAHTSFEVRWHTGLFVVGEAQLGIDSLLGDSPRFVPIELGATPLAAGVLAADHPFEVADRIVSDRDRLGELPRL